ncbi:MAG: M23 family metallopeptidase [Bdellovibrionales bacterium]
MPPFRSALNENAFERPKKQIRAAQTKSIDADVSFVWPIKNGVVTQKFRYAQGRRRGHKGIDIAAPKGTKVFASHDGVVIYAGKKFRGFGQFIIVETLDGDWGTFYSHLYKMRVQAGQNVRQGQVVGDVGKTGRATGYHLHFEVRHHKEPIDPLNVLP